MIFLKYHNCIVGYFKKKYYHSSFKYISYKFHLQNEMATYFNINQDERTFIFFSI